MDLKDHLVPTLLTWTGTPPTKPGFSMPHPTRPWTFPGIGHPQNLWATFWFLITFTVKNFFFIWNLSPSFYKILFTSWKVMISSPWSLLFSICVLSFLTEFPHRWIVFLYSSPGTHFWFLCLCIFFLFFTLSRRSSLNHAPLGPSMSKLIQAGIKSSEKNVLKELTALFSFIVPESCFPGESHPLLPQTTGSLLS